MELKIGQIRNINGRNCLITNGSMLDPVYHRVTNWWNWRIIMSDGSLGRECRGYGDERWPLVTDLDYEYRLEWVKVQTKRKLK